MSRRELSMFEAECSLASASPHITRVVAHTLQGKVCSPKGTLYLP